MQLTSESAALPSVPSATTLGLLVHLIGQFLLMSPPLLLCCHLILNQ